MSGSSRSPASRLTREPRPEGRGAERASWRVHRHASSSSFVAKVQGSGDDLLPEDPVPCHTAHLVPFRMHTFTRPCGAPTFVSDGQPARQWGSTPGLSQCLTNFSYRERAEAHPLRLVATRRHYRRVEDVVLTDWPSTTKVLLAAVQWDGYVPVRGRRCPGSERSTCDLPRAAP